MVVDAAVVEVIKSWIERPVSWGGEIEPTPTESNLARFEAAQTLVTPLSETIPKTPDPAEPPPAVGFQGGGHGIRIASICRHMHRSGSSLVA
jgi:hypothetical protein